MIGAGFPRLLVITAGVVSALFPAACASNPALRERPNGQPLSVVANERPVTVVEREQLVDVGAADGNGGFFGLGIGRDVERERVLRTVQLKQGLRVVDEQDFYEIAGDRAAFRQVKSYRSTGELMQAGGLGGAALGSAVMLGGIAVMSYGFTRNSFGPDGAMPYVLGGFLGGVMPGAVGTAVGYVIFFAGRSRLEPDQLVLPVERAQAAAEAYNAELAASPAGLAAR